MSWPFLASISIDSYFDNVVLVVNSSIVRLLRLCGLRRSSWHPSSFVDSLSSTFSILVRHPHFLSNYCSLRPVAQAMIAQLTKGI